ncbi:MAG: DNA/RNA non-specific endonuclease, partial [Saprospiraceae bacterium]|nr:DNA/RNA non-specific endonuclease [Saprospiraceae bacterium]
PQFLGADAEVPLPMLEEALQGEVAPTTGGGQDDLLHYWHYSALMHKTRRMAIYTVCNIDGNLLYNFPRGTDRWFYDPRMKREYQAGEELYADNKIQRGHLVRRLDPGWGATREAAKAAIDDTFFWTNCTPQHQNFNPRSWLSLEDYILKNADRDNVKVTVFTGPIFTETDKTYRGFRIPEEYWKVVAVISPESGRLSVTAYIVSQRDFMGDLELVVFGDFKTYHVPVKVVEKKTGLDFGLNEFDPLDSNESLAVRVIESAEDIML